MEKSQEVDLGDLVIHPYHPPSWLVGKLTFIPTHRLHLGNFPTPIQPWNFQVDGKKHSMLIKRDDFSESAASGNKIRKLEFIMAEVLHEGSAYDGVLSIGGTQSNHCRSVSAVAARLGVPCAHVLRKDAYYEDDKPLVGNLLFHQLFGARIFLVTKPEYVEKGQAKLLHETKLQLIAEAEARESANEKSGNEDSGGNLPLVMKRPFVVPVGGSSLTGLFGYVEFIRELEAQLLADPTLAFDEIVFSCGSGGTATGLVVGRLFCDSPLIRNAKLIGYTACDFPHVFHQHVNEMLDQLGITERSETQIEFIQSKNLGYAINTPREIDVIMQISKTSGVILDTCYSGKAVVEHVRRRSDEAQGEDKRETRRALFIHTGGIFSIFGKPELFVQQQQNQS